MCVFHTRYCHFYDQIDVRLNFPFYSNVFIFQLHVTRLVDHTSLYSILPFLIRNNGSKCVQRVSHIIAEWIGEQKPPQSTL